MSSETLSREALTDQFAPSPKAVALAEYTHKLEAENRALKSQVGTDLRLCEYIKEGLPRMTPLEPVPFNVPDTGYQQEKTPVLILTDAHAEEFVDAEEMEGLAAYSWDIFEHRMLGAALKTIETVRSLRQLYGIQDLHIWGLGDWFCGAIHPQDDGYGTSMTMPLAVPKTGFQLARLIMTLAPHFRTITVTGMCGNHGRTTIKPTYKMTADRNWDMSVYLTAKYICEASGVTNIVWVMPRSIMHVTDVMGWKSLLTHSGEVHMNNRVPYYPIETVVAMERNRRQGTAEMFNYWFMGHWHHSAQLDNSVFLCPSMIGANQYSMFNLHKQTVAAQSLRFFDKQGLWADIPIQFDLPVLLYPRPEPERLDATC